MVQPDDTTRRDTTLTNKVSISYNFLTNYNFFSQIKHEMKTSTMDKNSYIDDKNYKRYEILNGLKWRFSL